MKRLPINETLVYWGYNVLTLGLLWVMKIVIKKAIIEANAK
jgi:hypothetical protein